MAKKRSLRQLLLMTFVPLSAVPLSAAMIYSAFSYIQGMKEEWARRAALEVEQVSQLVQTRAIRVDSSAQSLAKHPPLIYAALSGDKALLASQLNQSLRVDGVGFATVWSTSGVMMGHAGVRPANFQQKQMRLVRKNGRSRTEVAEEERVGVVQVERLRSPVGREIGFLQIGFWVENEWLRSLQPRVNSPLVVFSPQGGLVASSLPEEQLKTVTLPVQQALREGSRTVNVEAFRFHLLPLLVSTKTPLAVLAVATSSEGVGRVVRHHLLLTFVLSLIAIAMVVALTWIASRRISQPLRKLVVATQELAAGRFKEIYEKAVSEEFEELNRAFEEMAHKVTSTKGTLEGKLEELQDANQNIRHAQGQLVQSAKMAGLGQLVAGVAHELNNPIGFIHVNMFHLEEYCRTLFSYIKMLEEQASLPDQKTALDIDYVEKDLFDLIRSCQDGARRTKDIVMALKTFSRLDETSLKETDINDGIQTTLKILRSELSRAQVSLNLDPSLPKLLVNASQLNQVWMNLIQNASQALPPQGGKIFLTSRRDANEIVIDVTDNGGGIPPEVMDKIFEPFFTTKDVGQGTGLGLSICYTVIQKHGGTISVSSKIGKGTTFSVRLPIATAAGRTGS